MKIQPLNKLDSYKEHLQHCDLSSLPGPLIVIVAEPNPRIRSYKRVEAMTSGKRSNHIIFAYFNCRVNDIPINEIRGRFILDVFSDDIPDEDRLMALKFANASTHSLMSNLFAD